MILFANSAALLFKTVLNAAQQNAKPASMDMVLTKETTVLAVLI